MKLEHYISNTIKQWPDLYVQQDYQHSRLAVLENLFFTIGTGHEWCKSGFVAEHIRGRTGDKRNFNIFNEPAQFESGFLEKWRGENMQYLRLVGLSRFVINPYPICKYSAIAEMINGKTNSLHIKNFELIKILPDWVEGAREIVEYARAYYKDYNLHKHHFHYKYTESWDAYVKKQNEYFDRFSEKFPKTV